MNETEREGEMRRKEKKNLETTSWRLQYNP